MNDPHDDWFDTEALRRIDEIESTAVSADQRITMVTWLVAAGVMLASLLAIFLV